MVTVDGSTFRASNSRLAYHSEKKIEKKIEHYNKVSEQYLALLDKYPLRPTAPRNTVAAAFQTPVTALLCADDGGDALDS